MTTRIVLSIDEVWMDGVTPAADLSEQLTQALHALLLRPEVLSTLQALPDVEVERIERQHRAVALADAASAHRGGVVGRGHRRSAVPDMNAAARRPPQGRKRGSARSGSPGRADPPRGDLPAGP